MEREDMGGVELLRSIAKRVPKDGDAYKGEDGRLYCKRCNTARQAAIKLYERVVFAPCMCECMYAAYQQEEEQRKKRERMDAIMSNRLAGFPERHLMNCTFANDDGGAGAVVQEIKGYVDGFEHYKRAGQGLYLFGGVGAGKTFFSACVVNALIEKGHPALMTNFARITNQLSGIWEGRQDYTNSLARYSLVAIDDLGVERDTAYMNEIVTTVIDALYRSNVPMLITSNYGPNVLAKEKEIRRKRVYDRILERCQPMEIIRQSRRAERGRASFQAIKKMLGGGRDANGK